MSEISRLEVPPLAVTNYLRARDNVQVTPNVLGVELNEPSEFADGTNPVSIGRLTMQANTGFEPHVHPHNHVLVILGGGGHLDYKRNGEMDRLEFKEGDVFNVPGTSEHAVSAGEHGIHMLTIASPVMRLLDPERMVFVNKEDRWMVPQELPQQ